LTSLSEQFVDLTFDALDIFQLVSDCERRLCISAPAWDKEKDNWDEYEINRISKLINRDFDRGARLRSEWGLLVIDEAQDLSQASWTLIDYLMGGSTIVFVVEGKNQLLYREKAHEFLSEGLPSVVPDENKRRKRRVFRTTSETFLLGQLFVESYPSLEKAQGIWTKTLQPRYLTAKKRDSHPELDFELTRKSGKAPSVVGVSLRDTAITIKLIAHSIRSAIERFKMSEDGGPSDILILVPFESQQSSWTSIALKACEQAGVSYMDYTQKELRRVSYSPDEVRISTYHSSRGIEGLHTIVLGFECLQQAAYNVDMKAANLGYISLTRSAFDTEVFYSKGPDQGSTRPVDFLNGLLEISGF
jgi:hypothetical protein